MKILSLFSLPATVIHPLLFRVG